MDFRSSKHICSNAHTCNRNDMYSYSEASNSVATIGNVPNTVIQSRSRLLARKTRDSRVQNTI